MRKYTLILGGIFLLSLALSLFLAILTWQAFITPYAKSLQLILLLGLFFAVSTMITILTLVAIALFKRIKQKKK